MDSMAEKNRRRDRTEKQTSSFVLQPKVHSLLSYQDCPLVSSMVHEIILT